MAEFREVRDTFATAVGLGMEFSDFSPSWVIVQLVIFLISTGLAVFDTYTDWDVVLKFKKDGFNNPLLPPNNQWYLAWLVFASIGTFLTVISFLHDGIDLLYLMCKSYEKNCTQKSLKYKYDITNPLAMAGDFEMKNKESFDIKNKEDEEREIGEPCTCCYNCGWNGTTRNETLGTLTLWFQDFPMLALAVLYAFSQTTCKTPVPTDSSKVYLDIGISASAALAASTWRMSRSFYRLFASVCLRMKCGKWSKKCLPFKGDSAYPPDTCAQCCIIPFYIGLLIQMVALGCVIGVVAGLWLNYAAVRQGKNFDDSLGIYRYSVNSPDELVLNISGTIFPPNGSHVNLEKIPYSQQPFRHEVYCLSEFEYREKETQIVFNAAEVQAVSEDGQFCITDDRPHSDNLCWIYYSFRNFSLYYASVNPTTGSIERFDDHCIIVFLRLNYRAVPVVDETIDVDRLIDKTGFPQNKKPLVMYNRDFGFHINATEVFVAPHQIYTPLYIYRNITCFFFIYYDKFNRRIRYNYRDVSNYNQPGCKCVGNSTCAIYYRNLVYGYLTPDHRIIQYTHCSTLPQEMLVPYYDPTISVSCPC